MRHVVGHSPTTKFQSVSFDFDNFYNPLSWEAQPATNSASYRVIKGQRCEVHMNQITENAGVSKLFFSL